MNEIDFPGETEFLRDHPGMSISPSRNKGLILKGVFWFSAKCENGPLLEDSFNLKILIPEKFPNEIPKVEEI